MLKIIDYFFLVFHSVLIIFNLFGWVWKATRRLNLITLLLTGGSWFILGIFYGFGYCPFTDWHFQVLRKLGHFNLPNSYIKYITDRLTGLDFKSELVDTVTLVLFLLALVISIYMNIRKKNA
jgi:hypothetical protein